MLISAKLQRKLLTALHSHSSHVQSVCVCVCVHTHIFYLTGSMLRVALMLLRVAAAAAAADFHVCFGLFFFWHLEMICGGGKCCVACLPSRERVAEGQSADRPLRATVGQ